MKTYQIFIAVALPAMMTSIGNAQGTADGYTNFIRQVQLPYEPNRITRDVYVPSTGEQLSPLEINPNGARFELHTVRATPLTSYILDTKYVGSSVPIGSVAIRSEDPYTQIPRTRADRPFYVDITMTNLLSGAGDAESTKKVNFLRHVQSYGTGDGTAIDRSQASLFSQSFLTENGPDTLTFTVSSIPGADRSKVRGEERFSIFTILDTQAPPSQLASQLVQVWPMAESTISGIVPGQIVRAEAPTVTLSITDIYPDSQVYAQLYPGGKVTGTVGTIVPGSAVIVKETVPQNRLLIVSDYDYILTQDGSWTMEILTSTPFGTEVINHVTFTVDRRIKVNGTVTTIE